MIRTLSFGMIFSSEGEKIGDVAAFQRDSDSDLIGLNAHLGGLLGQGETCVGLTPQQFRLRGEDVILELTADQAGELPEALI